MPKTNSIRSAVLAELRLMTDKQTDTGPWLVPRRLGCIASCGKKQASVAAHWPGRHLCCRQSMTISVINYNGRASELWGIKNLDDRRRSSLFSRYERPLFRVQLIVRSTIDIQGRNWGRSKRRTWNCRTWMQDTYCFITKKLNSLKHLVKTTVAKSHN